MKYGRQNGEVNQRTKIHILKWPLRTVQKSPPPMAAKNKLRYWRLKNCLISLFFNIVSQISIVKDYKIRFNTQRWTAMRTEGWTWVELGSFNAAIRHPLPTTLRRTILLVICIKIITMVIMVILRWHYWWWKWSWLHGKAWEDHEKPFPRFAVVMVLVMALNYWWMNGIAIVRESEDMLDWFYCNVADTHQRGVRTNNQLREEPLPINILLYKFNYFYPFCPKTLSWKFDKIWKIL